MQWEVFPTPPWPHGFGYREMPRGRAPIDGDQLELAPEIVQPERPAVSIVSKLRRDIEKSQLTTREFAQWVMGCSDVTVFRYLRGTKIPEDRRLWLLRLESATLHGNHLVIVVEAGAPTHKRWPRRHWRDEEQR